MSEVTRYERGSFDGDTTFAATFVVRILPPWHENLSKRQVKAPRIYVRDSGLLHALLDIDTVAAEKSAPG